jgi:regulator of protease activity HflC (stomatin/prohibitin superfamily)
VNGLLLFTIVFMVWMLIVVAKSVVVVPEGHAYVVERLGRFDRALPAGLHVVVPFVDVVRHRHVLAEETLLVPNEACRTSDDRHVWIDAAVTIKVVNPQRASYETADYRQAISQLARVTLRQQISRLDLDHAFADQADVSAAVAKHLGAATETWGVAVLRHDVTDISRHKKESAA